MPIALRPDFDACRATNKIRASGSRVVAQGARGADNGLRGGFACLGSGEPEGFRSR